ncbi:HNH endonuclease [Brachybacterium sp. JHP9]|uniref:HNH endonuclease n=1 Tax=Brachybacterium equifaecis TaxID=2910770 RepID=A0ABT0QXB9_9MICO|nr:HNH endonuclease signature motif containing protein [Brachybacterium equifaecis]MCL6422225.1 HNH endonuclease [Brachybacterium equifaecis]
MGDLHEHITFESQQAALFSAGPGGRCDSAPTARPAAAASSDAPSAAPLPGPPAAHAPHPFRRLTAPRPITPDSLARRVEPCPSPALDAHAQAIWEEIAEESRALARRFELYAMSWLERDHPECEATEEEIEAEDMLIAVASRCTIHQARARVRSAHRARHLLPSCFTRLAGGEFPAAWFQDMLRRTTDLSAKELAWIDVTVSTWDLRVEQKRFTKALAHLIAQVLVERETPPHLDPENRRRIRMLPGEGDGVGRLLITGPQPEIASFASRLDATARAVQDAQRRVIAEGREAPADLDGIVTATGSVSSLRELQYGALLSAHLETDGVEVPKDAYRLSVTVPVLSLLGVSNAPATLDGIEPIPADMARRIAAQSSTWFRVLTDPSTGAFLPCPAAQYRPTAAMREHLRLRNPQCAAPGCTRSIIRASECDHIEEFDHRDPLHGGPTSIENLHHLCRQHHDLKTDGWIDPAREDFPGTAPPSALGAAAPPTTSPPPGREPELIDWIAPRAGTFPPGSDGTRWSLRGRLGVFLEDDRDIMTPETVADLEQSWKDFEAAQEAHRAQHRGRVPLDIGDPPF